ncbi:MAG: tRNA 2-thiouridine(34) synthase MnmA [Bacteroidales bacterium]|jgi:tRNA-specific 2-thiouridylase|nr:tRNA 2-thiouridine(34) synthase MnmA [Bacteroidales bacterium]
MNRQKRVLLAMSGGLDSSVAAILLQKMGYEIIGITMKLWTYDNDTCSRNNSCCDIDAINDARNIAVQLNIPHYVLDFTKQFNDIVIGNFLNEYLHGRTPNPCILCNIHLKWNALIEKATELNCNYIATGHYANINKKDNRYFISKSKDRNKDQSYVLWGLTQDHLARTIFPLGNYTKEEVRKIAQDMGFHRIANKRESYDICFIQDNNYRNFLQQQIPQLEQLCPHGNFIDTSGKILGTHQGIPFYTIGQRKGLVIALGVPQYVCHINTQTNEITLGNKENLLSDNLIIRQYNLMKYAEIPPDFIGETKIRYKNKGQTATIVQYDDCIKVKFHLPVSAITAGQSAVVYEDNDIVAGGIIDLT